MNLISIHDEKGLRGLLKESGINPDFYGKIRKAVYKDMYTDFSLAHYLNKDIQELLNSGKVRYASIRVDSLAESQDAQTTKFLLKTHDDMYTECVLMRHLSGRNTLCVSSQVGCPMACTFCATGKIGMKRNLDYTEILDQVMIASLHLKKEGRTLRNIVFMGMGEPLLNYSQVKTSIEIMVDQQKVDLSSRRVTVSTCGIVPGIEKFGKDFPLASLAISLHAPTDEARKAIMPVNHTYPLKKLMKALDEYCERTQKKIFYEYIMIRGDTDKIEYAPILADLLKDRPAHINFIPYNPGENIGGDGMQPSDPNIIKTFQRICQKAGVPTTIRMTMGDDIAAACGQLANKKEKAVS